MIQDSRIKQKKQAAPLQFWRVGGFTLVELLVTISIIAILSAVMVISYSNTQKNSRDQRRIADLKAIQNAAEQVMMLSGTYPVTSGSYVAGRVWQAGGQTVLQSYPKDPKNSGSYVYSVHGINSSVYCVCALMENNKNANADISSDTCDFQNNGGYFCVKNQQ